MWIAPPVALLAFLSAQPAVVAQADVHLTVSPSQLPDAGGTLAVTFSVSEPPVSSVTANGVSVNFKQNSPTSISVSIPPKSSLGSDTSGPIGVTIITAAGSDGTVSALSTSFTFGG